MLIFIILFLKLSYMRYIIVVVLYIILKPIIPNFVFERGTVGSNAHKQQMSMWDQKKHGRRHRVATGDDVGRWGNEVSFLDGFTRQ